MRFSWAGYYQTEGKRGQRNLYFWGIQGKAVAGAGVAGITSQVSNAPKTYRTPELSQISQSLTPSDVRYLFVRASFARSFVVVAESQNLINECIWNANRLEAGSNERAPALAFAGITRVWECGLSLKYGRSESGPGKRRSECEPQRELHDAVSHGCAADDAGAGIADGRSGIGELRMIEDVVGLAAKLEAARFPARYAEAAV